MLAATGVLLMAGAMAMEPQPDRRAAEEQAAREQAAEAELAFQQRLRAEAERVRAEVEQAAQQRAEAERQALDLSMSRELVKANNSATAALEAYAAYSNVYELPFFQEQEQIEQKQFLVQM